MTSPGVWVTVAKVRSVQTQRRELRIDLVRPFAWPDPAPQWVRVKSGGEVSPTRLKIAETQRDEQGGVVLVLPPGVPRETVSALRGTSLVVPEAEAEDTYRVDGWYAPKWVGYSVQTAGGEKLGVVREVWTGPANAAFTVELISGDAWVLPVIEQVVTDVDEDAETLTITGLEPHGVRHED